MLIAHVALPLILYGISPHLNLPQLSLIPLLWGAGVPSLDVLPTFLRKETPEDPLAEEHGATLLHTPFFFLVTLPPLAYFFGTIPALSFSLGGLTHVFIDALDVRGRRLLYPLSQKFFGAGALPYDFWTYVTSNKMLAIEGSLFVLSIVLVLVH